METGSLPTAEQKPPKLPWYQWRLRSMFILMTLVAVACSWLTVTIRAQKRQYEAAADIKKAGGTVMSEQTWLGKVLRDDTLVNVTDVNFYGKAITDAELEQIKGLSQLRQLNLSCSKITDAGLVHLRGLHQLQLLGLSGTKVSDAGLV
jgi:Leucine-rich repeat (LRR) protein